jgi:Protein of unknown function (DUF2384)
MTCVRYPLSLGHLEELLHERGIDTAYETVRLWWNRFGMMFAAEIFWPLDVPDETAAILLDLPLRSFRRWKAGEIGRIDRDQRARLSNLMGVHKALRILFRQPQRGYDWFSRPNATFGGASALDVMRGGELTDIMCVRRYLDAERGAW